MKLNLFSLFSLLLIVGSFQSCVKDSCEREVTYRKAIPVYQTWEEIRTTIKSESSRTLVNTGKLYFYNDYLFINESREGIHVIDNSDPSNPQTVSFIPIPGNVDIAIRNNTLYADNYTDLLAIDLSDVMNVKLIKRLEEVFPHLGETELGIYTHNRYEMVTETVDCNRNFNDDFALAESSNGGRNDFSAPTSNGGQNSDGQGGSFARFSLYDSYLYTISESELFVFDVSQEDCPNHINTVPTRWGIETIFAFGDKLFIGSSTGMDIFDASNPALPVYISGYQHFNGCDPVYVNGNYAYVTIRGGNDCGGAARNQLDILNISDIFNPILERTIPMESPHGLSILDDHLYLCEGEAGLKVFDASQPLEPVQLAHVKSFDAYDVIGLVGSPNRLLLIGADGFYQFDVSDPSNPQLLSLLAVQR